MSVTVLFDDDPAVTVDAHERDGHLWLAPADFEAATGWTLKPEGLCREAACVPLPADGSWRDAEGRLDLTAFTARFGRPVVHDAERGIWAFGESADARTERVLSLQAPDFTLPDLDDNLHSLSDFRGKKVFLTTWGSYCGCSYDLAVWQVLYDELKDRNFEIIAVALDAGGKEAVQKKASIRPTAADLADRDPVLRPLQGWGEEEWSQASAPQYTCLIDEEHLLADLFSVTIVPMAVWINEEGRIVRPAEVPGHSDWFRRYDKQSFVLPDEDAEVMIANRRVYWDALRDWVDQGDASEFALSPEAARAKVHRPSEDEVRAALHARIGAHLFHAGDWQAAKRHYEEAVRLVPEKWNYRRQSMVLEPELIGQFNVAPEFFAAQDALGTNEYFPTIDMPGITGAPPWLEDAER